MPRIVACPGGAAQQEVGIYDGFRPVSHLTRDPLGFPKPRVRGSSSCPGSFRPKLRIRPGVIFGEPLGFSRYYGKESDRAVLRAVTGEIIQQVHKLSGQEYVDIYAKQAKDSSQPPATEPD
jgi:hypothetical protein